MHPESLAEPRHSVGGKIIKDDKMASDDKD